MAKAAYKPTAKDFETLAARAQRTDPLFNSNPDRDFEPTVEDVVTRIDWEGIPYDFPHSGREKSSISFDPDRLAAVKTLATQWDMTVSATVDVLLRVALGDIAQFEANTTPPAPKEEK